MTRARLLTPPFLLAALINLITGLALHAYLHLPGFLDELGADELGIGVLVGLLSAAAILFRPVAGRIMDRRSRRSVILGGLALCAVASLLYLAVDSLGALIVIARVLHGAGEGAVFSGLFAYAADIIPEERRAEGIGIFGVSGMIPVSLGGLMGDAILSRGGYEDLFSATFGLNLLALLLALPLRERARSAEEQTERRGFLAALAQRDLIPLWFVGTAFTFAFAALFAFVKAFVEAERIATVGLFFTTYAVAAILLRLLLGWLPDRVGRKRVLIPAMLSIGLGLAILGLARSSLHVGIAGILAGVGHGYAFPIISALVVSRVRDADRGSAVALLTALFDFGLVSGGPILGAVAKASDYRTMYLVAAAVPVVSLAIFLPWDHRVEKGEPYERTVRVR